eukprot:gene15504-21591_t
MLANRSFVSTRPNALCRRFNAPLARPLCNRGLHAADRRTRIVRYCDPKPQVKLEGALPEGVSVLIKGPDSGDEIEYDQETKTLRLPLSAAGGGETRAERRSRLVIFTCNKCGGRTARNVNPIAWDNGLVMCQCGHCEVWHTLSANNKQIYEEIVYDKEEAALIRAANFAADTQAAADLQAAADMQADS